jgi:single-strand DNA-binding protein
MADSTVTLVGNTTRDPELRYTPTGRATSSFGLAVSRRWQKDGKWQEQTSFFNIVCWASLAENVSASITKGSRVIVSGSLEQRSWDTAEGEKRTIVEINADAIGPDLRWATAEIARTEREKVGAPAEEPF